MVPAAELRTIADTLGARPGNVARFLVACARRVDIMALPGILADSDPGRRIERRATARETSAFFGFCYQAVRGIAVLVELPLVTPLWLMNIQYISTPIATANSLLWGISLYCVMASIGRYRSDRFAAGVTAVHKTN